MFDLADPSENIINLIDISHHRWTILSYPSFPVKLLPTERDVAFGLLDHAPDPVKVALVHHPPEIGRRLRVISEELLERVFGPAQELVPDFLVANDVVGGDTDLNYQGQLHKYS